MGRFFSPSASPSIEHSASKIPCTPSSLVEAVSNSLLKRAWRQYPGESAEP